MPASPPRSETKDFLFFLLKLALFVILLRSLVVAPFNIPSESMQPRLLIGDYLLVAKWPYGYTRFSLPANLPLVSGRFLARTPERGDVVVFAAPANDGEDWIKRVVGLPGDRIEVRGGTVWLNGRAVPRTRIDDLVIPVTPNMIAAAQAERAVSPCFQQDYEARGADGARQCRYPRFVETLPGGKSYEVLDILDGPADNVSPHVVPPGHVFVMGDNRDRSADSRIAVENGGVGPLPMDHLVGRALFSFFSTDGSAVAYNPLSWFTATRVERIGAGF
jgi:signal peptidase I